MSDFAEALEHRHTAKGENYLVRTESQRHLTLAEWKKVNAKMAAAIAILKEGEK